MPNRIEDWALATKIHEGYFKPGENPKWPNGTAAWANNNPGNIRPTTYSKSLGAHHTSGARGNFVFYKSYEIGWAALKQFLFDAATDVLYPYRKKRDELKLKSTRDLTLEQFYSVYAPQSDGNNPNRYAAHVAELLKVPVNTKIGFLIADENAPAPTPTPGEFRRVKPGQIISRSQKDPRWAKVKIGNSPYTVASDGCVITGISDILWWYGYDITPGELAQLLRFTPGGKIYWESVTEKLPIKFIYRYWNFNAYTQSLVNAALKHPTQTVIMELDYSAGNNSFKHWVFSLVKQMVGYKMADPLRGDFSNTSLRYGGRLTGATLFDIKK